MTLGHRLILAVVAAAATVIAAMAWAAAALVGYALRLAPWLLLAAAVWWGGPMLHGHWHGQ